MRKIIQVKCDVCGQMFEPKRWNIKRCSDRCRFQKRREDENNRWVKQKEWRKRKLTEKKVCIICMKNFMGWEYRKTCSRKCADRYSKYRNRIRVFDIEHREITTLQEVKNYDDYGFPILKEHIPLPEHEPINVGKVDIKSSSELKKAIDLYVENGGTIRKFKADTGVNMLLKHPLAEEQLQDEDIVDQVTGKIRVK